MIEPVVHVGSVDDGEVGCLPRFQRSSHLGQAHSPCGVDRGTFENLGRRHALQRAGEHHRKRKVVTRRRTRVEIGSDRNRNARLDESASRHRRLPKIQ